MARRIVLAVVVVLALGAAAIYWFLSGDGIRLALERQASAWLGQPVQIAEATAQIVPRIAIQLRDVRVGDPVRLSLADVEVSAGLRALLSRRVEDAEITIADSRIELPLPFAIPSGASASETGSGGGGGFTVASIRAITLDDVRIVSRGREIAVSASAALAGTRLNLESFTATSGETSVEASGVVELEPRLDAKIEAAANRLDLDDLLALVEAFTPEPQAARAATRRTGPLLPGRLAAKLTADEGTAAGVEFTDFVANLRAQGDRVTLSPASFAFFGGRYEGALEATLASALDLSVTSRIQNLDVAQLAAFGGVPEAISGRLSGSGKFTGRGRDVAAVLAAARGSGSATIADGVLPGLELVRTVILFFGRPEEDAPTSKGSRFDRIATSFTLERQVVRADSLTMESPDVDVAATGSLTIPTKALEGRANLLLSESLSAQAGTDLQRYTREGNRVVLPATIGGTLSRPRVMIDAAAALKRGIQNELQRRLKGLFDRIKPPPR